MIKVKRDSDGAVFDTGMRYNTGIIEIHFCTSYTQVRVQEEKDGMCHVHDIICPPIGTKPNFVDLIATQDDETGVLFWEDAKDE